MTKQRSLFKFSDDKRHIHHHKFLYKKRKKSFYTQFPVPKHLKSTLAPNIEHELKHSNRIATSDLEKG